MRQFAFIEAISAILQARDSEYSKLNLRSLSKIIACATIFLHQNSSKKLRLHLDFERACAICTNRSQITFFCDKPFTFSPFCLLLFTAITFNYIFFEIGFLSILFSEKEGSERAIYPFGAINSSFLFLCFLCFLLEI